MITFLYTQLAVIIYLKIFSLAAGVITVIERRIAGRIQSRVGPNRIGPNGSLQWLVDGIKAIQKEDIIPNNVNRLFFRISPYLVFMGVFASLAPIPFAMHASMASLDLGIFYILAMTSFVVVGLVMGGWASNNKWSLLGGLRSAAQLVSYEIPIALSVLVIILMAGSMNLEKIILAQGAAPHDWFLFRNPFTFITFFVFFISAVAEANRVPFDIPEAETELVSGYNTEYSGMRFLFFFFAEWANLVVIGAVIVALFLGGGNFWWSYEVAILLPGMTQPFMLEILSLFWFFAKISAVIFLLIQLRWTLPRLRVDQMMSVCWKYLVPMVFACSVGVMLWLYFVPIGSSIDLSVRYIMTAIGSAFLLLFWYRVWFNFKESRARLHLNPFI